MLADVRSIQGKLADRADFVSVDVADKANRGLVSRYDVESPPMPLTIVIAPNGAITAGFAEISQETQTSPPPSSRTERRPFSRCLQGGKMAVVCIQRLEANLNKECQATARGLKADSRLGGAVEIVTIDASDRSESKLMKQWKIDADSANAQLVVVAPPGKSWANSTRPQARTA